MYYVSFHTFSVRTCNGLLHTINLLAKNLTVAGVDVQIQVLLTTALIWIGQLHTPSSLPPWKKCALNRRLGGPQNRSGWCGEGKILPLPEFKIWPFGRPACIQSLHRLHYPGSPISVQGHWQIEAPHLTKLVLQAITTGFGDNIMHIIYIHTYILLP
jgi:hypothetical protein